MKLPDFEQFEPMNTLRKKMGAEELGSFEPFDPKLQLTSLEVDSLSKSYIDISFDRLRFLPDDTLAYKNARVFLFEKKAAEQQEVGLSVYSYHFAHCNYLKGRGKQKLPKGAQVFIATDYTQALESQVSVLSREQVFEVRPCWECLHALRVDGFDGDKHRKRLHSEQVWRSFEIPHFTQKYIMYPLPEELWG